MSTPMQHIFPKKDKVFSTPLRPITTDKIVRTPLDPKVPHIEPEPEAPKTRRARKPSDED